MVLCVVYLTEPSRRSMAHLIAFSCCILTLFALTYGLVAYNSKAKFSDHIMHLLRHSLKNTKYMLHSFENNVWMAVQIFFWCVVVSMTAFVNAGPKQRWAQGKSQAFFCLIDLLSTLSLLASLAAFFVNFFAVAELEKGLFKPMQTVFSMYNAENDTAGLNRHRVDFMQYQLQCCGLFYWSDWMMPPLALYDVTKELADQEKLSLQTDECQGKMYCYVPWTCCRPNTTDDTCQYRANLGRTLLSTKYVDRYLYSTGCYVMLVEHLSWFLRTSSLFWIGMFGCQLIIFISWRLLTTSIKSWYKLELNTIMDKKHPAIAPGWLVPCCGYPAGVYLGEDNDKVDTQTWGVGMQNVQDDDDDSDAVSTRSGGGDAESEGGDGGGGGGGGEDGAAGGDKKGKKKKKSKKKKNKKSKKKKPKGGRKKRMKRRGRRGGARGRMRRK